MTKNRLITFGCSLTYGQALEDREQESWPAQLGKLLNYEVVNQGRCGSSVKRIWWEVLNFPFKENDLVIIGWTHKDRWCIIKEDTTNLEPGSKNYDEWNVDSINDMYKKIKEKNLFQDLGPWLAENNHLAKTWYQNFHDDFDMALNCFLCINHIDYYLKDKNIRHFHLDMTEHEYFPKFNQVKFLPVNMNNIRHQFPLATDGWHPGKLAFEHFSKEIYKLLHKEEIY